MDFHCQEAFQEDLHLQLNFGFMEEGFIGLSLKKEFKGRWRACPICSVNFALLEMMAMKLKILATGNALLTY